MNFDSELVFSFVLQSFTGIFPHFQFSPRCPCFYLISLKRGPSMVNELPLLLSLANFLPKIPENHWASSRARKSLVMDTRAKIVVRTFVHPACMAKPTIKLNSKLNSGNPRFFPAPNKKVDPRSCAISVILHHSSPWQLKLQTRQH